MKALFLLSFCLFPTFLSDGIRKILNKTELTSGVLTNQGRDHYEINLDELFDEGNDDNPTNIFLIPWVGGLRIYAAIMDSAYSFPSYVYCYSQTQDEIEPNGKCMEFDVSHFNSIRFNSTSSYFEKYPWKGMTLKITVTYPPLGTKEPTFKYEQIPYYIYYTKGTDQRNIDQWDNLPANTPIINELRKPLEYDYYNFEADEIADIRVGVSTISGDDDPFVFLSSCTLTPNFGTQFDHMYFSSSSQYENIIAQVSDGPPRYNCTQAPCMWGMSSTASNISGSLYYSMYWEKRGRSYTHVYEGMQLGSVIHEYEWQYFKFFLPQEFESSSKLVVSLTEIIPISGNYTQMYMIKPSTYQKDPTQKPSKYHCDYCGGQNWEITVDEAGYYFVGVYGTEEAKFKISWVKESSVWM